MKKYNLKQTWKYCMAMWKWIAEEWQKDRRNVIQLKGEWVEKHGFSRHNIENDCFFCHYQNTHPRKKFSKHDSCPRCPGIEVAPLFDCFNSGWNTDPVKFYRILRRMYSRKKKLAGWK